MKSDPKTEGVFFRGFSADFQRKMSNDNVVREIMKSDPKAEGDFVFSAELP